MRVFIALAAVIVAVSALVSASAVIEQPPKLMSANGVNGTYSNWEFCVQKCSDDAPWTIHGLWPPTNECGGPSFDITKIKPLLSEMGKVWKSCPSDHKSDDWMWNHEWTKHGTCSGMDEYSFFSQALQYYQQGVWKSKCENSYEKECKVVVNPSMLRN